MFPSSLPTKMIQGRFYIPVLWHQPGERGALNSLREKGMKIDLGRVCFNIPQKHICPDNIHIKYSSV